jgi:hypothetical protein
VTLGVANLRECALVAHESNMLLLSRSDQRTLLHP